MNAIVGMFGWILDSLAYLAGVSVCTVRAVWVTIVDAMITNFHLPRSSLLMLVSAFAGTERIRRAYREAVARRYRFYSFGDGMLIL